ncbi:MAG TPA: phosphonate C-P lyase system protein PhnH [Trebonia sp.]
MTTSTAAAGFLPAGAARPAGLPTALTRGGAQAVFRATLDVLARPGTVKRLPSATEEPLAAHVPPALLPLLALADLSTRVCVIGEETDPGADGRTAWDEIVRVATNAPRAELGDARLVAALRPLGADELGRLRTGTAISPEDGALACLAVSRIAVVADASSDDQDTGNPVGDADADGGGDGARLLRVSGPGVPGTRAITVAGLPAGFATARQGLVAGFPAGADLLLIAPDGAMTGLSRTTTVSEETF